MTEETHIAGMRFQVLTAASMKSTVLWDIAPCSLVEVDRRFWGAYCLHHLLLRLITNPFPIGLDKFHLVRPISIYPADLSLVTYSSPW
jgi:hypothetical protein